jgi:type II secretory pathway pseudopilin PulG
MLMDLINGLLVRFRQAVRARIRSERGTTLTELAIVVALLGVVVAPAYMFLVSSQRNQRVVDESVQQQQTARVALETFSRSLREATFPQGYNYSESSLFSAAASMDVSFYSDFGNDGVVDRIRYFLDSANSRVQRTVTEPDCSGTPCSYGPTATSSTSTVVENVRNADLSACSGGSGSQKLFQYYSVNRSSGAPSEITSSVGVLYNLVDINYVKMTVVVDITPGKSPTCQSIDTAVSLRNWRG